MAAIKPLDRIVSKWANMSAAATEEYRLGIENPRVSWNTATRAAEKNFTQGVQAAIAAGRFGKRVAATPDSKWRDGALTKGVPRWSQGIAASQANYEAGFGPYHAIIKNTNLPARGPKGDPANIQRVAVLDKALRDEKLRRMGA
jgi:hypothetical protein